MITLLQRVLQAHVDVDNQKIAKIEQGLLVFVGVQAGDDGAKAEKYIDRVLNYRVFADAGDKMNLSILDIQAGLLLVPQFTLAANTKKGRRPSFGSAAEPTVARTVFENMTKYACDQYDKVACGQFGADMKVHLINDGPVTFILDDG